MTKYLVYAQRTITPVGYTETEEQAKAYVAKIQALHVAYGEWQSQRQEFVKAYFADRDIVYPNPYIDKGKFLLQKDLFNAATALARQVFEHANPAPVIPKHLLWASKYAYKKIEELN